MTREYNSLCTKISKDLRSISSRFWAARRPLALSGDGFQTRDICTGAQASRIWMTFVAEDWGIHTYFLVIFMD